MTLFRPARRTRALLFVSICFVASAATRIGEVGVELAGGMALANSAAAAAPEPTALRPDAHAPGDGSLSDRAAACDAEPGPLLEAIRERIAAIEARETHVAERERVLEVTEARVKAEIDRMAEAERKLAATLALADGASERDVAHLVSVYETMKPKNAAAIFDAMEPRFAAGFLSRMRKDSAAGILANMQEGAAYAVTAVMAGRHVSGQGVAPPPEDASEVVSQPRP